MRVLLKAPTEEVCCAFETLLVGTGYYSDDAEGSEDVCYTVDDKLEGTVRDWTARTQDSGLLALAQRLDNEGEERNTLTPDTSQHRKTDAERKK